MAGKNGTKLKAMHERFAQAYLEKPIAKTAAIAAGYSERTAHVIGPELLQRPDVQAYLAERTGKALVASEATVERIVRELASIGFSDLTTIFVDGPDGTPRLRPISEWPQEIRLCIAAIETSRKVLASAEPGSGDLADAPPVVEAEIVTKIKLWPKVQALELLARYRKMLGADNLPGDQVQQFVGLQVTVAPGATANIQVNAPGGAKGDDDGR